MTNIRERQEDLSYEECGRRRREMEKIIGTDAVGTRLINALMQGDITTPRLFMETADEEIAGLRNVGSRCMSRVAEVRERLNEQ